MTEQQTENTPPAPEEQGDNPDQTTQDAETLQEAQPEAPVQQQAQASDEEQGTRVVRNGVEYIYTEEHGHRAV